MGDGKLSIDDLMLVINLILGGIHVTCMMAILSKIPGEILNTVIPLVCLALMILASYYISEKIRHSKGRLKEIQVKMTEMTYLVREIKNITIVNNKEALDKTIRLTNDLEKVENHIKRVSKKMEKRG